MTITHHVISHPKSISRSSSASGALTSTPVQSRDSRQLIIHDAAKPSMNYERQYFSIVNPVRLISDKKVKLELK